ncbi:hypothetical protein JL107_07785 [Nakamurella flavida]|uniref:HpcH/HpaI aldolase/citrate lyase domain-containing protein n=1 Tax=Nakamurella flavida TaxID=363630 RepID=A0A939C044_9ACTN|nr:aldolase/citrate lyase family protein [Nakamurella flavida]MBM9476338.1 hypothetical protein [Nakamurella flavida]MDP9779562.1 4-hydroxy-2-oxoheptanedioate aldolase [Nakamurella flavida]
MRRNRVRDLLAQDEQVVTGWVTTGSSYAAEVVAHSGVDAVTLDLQHGMFDVPQAIACLQAVSTTSAVPLVRCRSHDAADIGHLLDAGAYGIICPNVDTDEQAQALVRACRYPPTGRRSLGPSRGVLYGGADYPQHADDTVLVIPMIESVRAVENLDAILAVDGVDAVFVGPTDLSWDAGLPPTSATVADELADLLRHIVDRARAASVPAGIFSLTPDQGRQFAEWGYRLIAPGTDMMMLRAATERAVAVLRRV